MDSAVHMEGSLVLPLLPLVNGLGSVATYVLAKKEKNASKEDIMLQKKSIS